MRCIVKKFSKILIIGIIIFPIIIWLFALMKCEVLTLLHGDEFEKIYQENTMIGDIDYLKILDYSDTSARVYYVGYKKSGGDVLIFEKQNGVWKYAAWEQTVWSGTGGSASEVIWPYWWHFIYGGF